MNSSSILSITTFIYGLAASLYLAAWIFKKPQPGKMATLIAVLGATGNLSGIVTRWIESYRLGIGHAPLSNMYESLIFFAFMVTLIFLVIESRHKNRIISVFAATISFLAMAYASLSPNVSDRILPLIPALKSNWLIVHVVTCFLGYAAFATAFGINIMYLLKSGDKEGKNRLRACFPEPHVLDDLTHQIVMFGFLFLTIGIITGAVWANSAWGDYWSWDPKETWSLITWFIYATLLHARLLRGWYGKRIVFLSIIGFVAVLFTYFGVNLLPGLHSYGKG
jgi:cytochrome c-type biogenesis protein CcsB